VVAEFEEGLGGVQGPDEEAVVVAAGAKLLAVGRPLEAAYFLLVACEFEDVGGVGTDVAVQDGFVP
jgi:hypothetical protein